jgi:hypothetical protein
MRAMVKNESGWNKSFDSECIVSLREQMMRKFSDAPIGNNSRWFKCHV